jgi:hypothetical protein
VMYRNGIDLFGLPAEVSALAGQVKAF